MGDRSADWGRSPGSGGWDKLFVSDRPRLMSDWPKLRFVLTSFCLGMIALHCTVFWLARYRLLAGSPDFSIFYTAGLMVRHGQGSVLYSDQAQGAAWREVVPGTDVRDHPLPFNHPPFEALLFVILTYLPYLRAYFLWLLVNLLLVGASAFLMRPWLPTLGSSFSLLLILAPFAFFPIAYGLLQGQDSILLLVLYCLAYGAFRRSQDLRAGVFLGLGLFKFHLVLPFAFILLLRRRWQALGGILVGFGFGLCRFLGGRGMEATPLLSPIRIADQSSATGGRNRPGKHAEPAGAIYRMDMAETCSDVAGVGTDRGVAGTAGLGVAQMEAGGVARHRWLERGLLDCHRRNLPCRLPQLQPRYEYSVASGVHHTGSHSGTGSSAADRANWTDRSPIGLDVF